MKTFISTLLVLAFANATLQAQNNPALDTRIFNWTNEDYHLWSIQAIYPLMNAPDDVCLSEQISNTYFDLESGDTLFQFLTTNQYDELFRVTSSIESIALSSDNTYLDMTEKVFSYNDQNQPIGSIVYSLNGAPSPSSQTLYVYNANNWLEQENHQIWDAEQWVDDHRISYTYDASGLIILKQKEGFNAIDQTWQIVDQTISTYQNNQLMTQVNFQTNVSNVLVAIDSSSLSYNDQGQLTTWNRFNFYNVPGTLSLFSSTEYTYNDEGLLLEYETLWYDIETQQLLPNSKIALNNFCQPYLSNIGVDEFQQPAMLLLGNPSHQLQLGIHQPIKNSLLTIYNSTGQIMLQMQVADSTQVVNLNESMTWPVGIYYVRLQNPEQSQTSAWMKH